MKKALCLLVIVFSIIIFIWSQYAGLTLSSQVLHKKLTVSPIQGSWIVEKYVSIGGTTINDEKAKQLLGKIAYFRGDTVEFNGNISKDVKYKVKSVNTKSYFWNSIKISAKSLGIKNTDVQIITINSNETFFDEYIKLNDLTLIKNYEGTLLYFHKAKDSSAAHSYNKDNNTKILISKAEKEIRSKSGLLLGLRYENPQDDVGLSKYSYKTLWISSVNNKMLPILETKDLLLPRQDGFWKVGIGNKIKNGDSKDILWSYPINLLNPTKPINSKKIKYTKTEGSIAIKFVGSNYVSTDTVQDVNNNDLEKKYSNNKLKIFPMDNLMGEPIKLTSILPREIEKATLPGTILNINKSTQYEKLEKVDNNLGVIRRSGRWILRGRMPQSNSEDSFIDFDIPYATPKSLTTYDNLFPSFNVIKTKVPSAVDAYSSPNRDFVVVLTNTELMVFSIKGYNLGEKSLTLEFKAGEVPVMSQWATGSYVDEWQKKVK
ncbi:hypothetical protein [Clostridium estertheticum]|uniref:hypothetical protein n=1 Tax=Clostridium estertheticum TaxID=238834 RepID=UPI001C7CACD2|nr:hypothetical protein [Clostridium estertheticum]MBX4264978.1 hypothetical protein [Clostridium estertheticum]MBX4270443.1 hypothetical protein [Clostridium estertheticum]WLC81309.1 hypothetical protein KTC98_08890 [Clostridium estertheticum]WLC88446.1 hypothetical protein KTC95_20995 [Clostridium estertheticum]